MRFYTHIIIAALLCIFVSCSDKNENTGTSGGAWQKNNVSYFREVYDKAKGKITDGDTDWKIIRCTTKSDSAATTYENAIVAEVLHRGEGTVSPYSTDSVRVHYRGTLYNGTQFDSSWIGDYNLATMRPASFQVNMLCKGFMTALQYMVTGDRWRVYMPYQLGYGSASQNSIPAYSALVFDITLEAIGRPGNQMPPLK